MLLAPVLLFAPAGVPSTPTNAVLFVLPSTVGTLAYALGTATLGGAIGAYLAAVHRDDHGSDVAESTTGTVANPDTAGSEDRATANDD